MDDKEIKIELSEEELNEISGGNPIVKNVEIVENNIVSAARIILRSGKNHTGGNGGIFK